MLYNEETARQINHLLQDLLFWFTVLAGILSPIFSYAAAVFWPALLCVLFIGLCEAIGRTEE